MASKTNLSVVIDIGTSKIVAIAGKKNELGKVKVLAAAKIVSKGIKRGVVFNIDEVADCINQVITQLEDQLEETITTVNVAYAGQQMKTIDYQNSRITSEEGIVTKADVDFLYNEAKKVEFEEAFNIIQVIPTSFIVDNEETFLSPVSTTGRKIVAKYKLVVVPELYVANLQRVFEKTSVELGEITLATLAVSEAVITEDEKELGAVVLDVGAGTTNLAIYYENRLMHTAVIPFGGSVVTKDIKEGCSILLKWAEQMKVKYGGAMGDFANNQKYVTIPVHNGCEPKEISFRQLAYIIQARLDEILDVVNAEIEKSGVVDYLGGGIVLTGRASNLDNFTSLVKFRTGMDARLANLAFNPICEKTVKTDPAFYTVLGLLNLEVNKSEIPEKKTRSRNKTKKDKPGFSILDKVVQGALGLFEDDNEDLAMN